MGWRTRKRVHQQASLSSIPAYHIGEGGRGSLRFTMPADSCRQERLVYGKADPERQIVDLFLPGTQGAAGGGFLSSVLRLGFSRDGRANHTDDDGSDQSLPLSLLIFVHGGAWVSETNRDHYDLARFIAGHSNTAVALVDYRLSSTNTQAQCADGAEQSDGGYENAFAGNIGTEQGRSVYHPNHVGDVFAALEMLLEPKTAHAHGYIAEGAVLAGHSAGGWMTLATALDSQHPHMHNRSTDGILIRDIPPLQAHVRASIKAYVVSEGIFSLVELLREYPDYISFVTPAFYPPHAHPQSPYTELTRAGAESWHVLEEPGSYHRGADQPTVFVFHSPDDSLLSTHYNRMGVEALREKNLDVFVDNESFRGDHDEVIHSDAFWLRLIEIVHGVDKPFR